MKIISWNCNGALRKKTEFIDSYSADILVIQECEDPSQSTKAYRSWAGDYLWHGDNKNKGIGIFARNGHKVEKLDWSGEFTLTGIKSKSPALTWRSEELKSFLPCKINDEYTLLGVWTKANDSTSIGYMGQFWKYLQIHRDDLSGDKTIICGDFNSNAIWDEPGRWWNHSDVVNELEDIGLRSVYHHAKEEKQGEETQKTLFLQKNSDKAYHIDYFFASEDLLSNSDVNIANPDQWIEYSDHAPIILDNK
ncbi:endonuclease/exonuclease/phosphatase family protein [bacterium]|nr:endonuclease/exonuclease/phosphatase family protein [bacterium]